MRSRRRLRLGESCRPRTLLGGGQRVTRAPAIRHQLLNRANGGAAGAPVRAVHALQSRAGQAGVLGQRRVRKISGFAIRPEPLKDGVKRRVCLHDGDCCILFYSLQDGMNKKLGAPIFLYASNMPAMAYDAIRARAILKKMLDGRGLSYRAASKLGGVSPATVGKFLKGDTEAMGADIYVNLVAALRDENQDGVLVSDLLGERPYRTPFGRRVELIRQALCPDLPERMRLSEADWIELVSQTGPLPRDRIQQVADFTGVPERFIETGDPAGLGRVQMEALLQGALSDTPPNPPVAPPTRELSENHHPRKATRKRS